jgi:O-antigen/teichoic acid export membrane protein
VSWLSTLVVIRLLSPTDYGLMAMTIVFTSLLTLISQMGVSSALIQTKEWRDNNGSVYRLDSSIRRSDSRSWPAH